MSEGLELTPAQAEAVDELRGVLGAFGLCLEHVRESGLPVVDAFRAAGIEIPGFVPPALLENLLAPA